MRRGEWASPGLARGVKVWKLELAEYESIDQNTLSQNMLSVIRAPSAIRRAR